MSEAIHDTAIIISKLASLQLASPSMLTSTLNSTGTNINNEQNTGTLSRQRTQSTSTGGNGGRSKSGRKKSKSPRSKNNRSNNGGSTRRRRSRSRSQSNLLVQMQPTLRRNTSFSHPQMYSRSGVLLNQQHSSSSLQNYSNSNQSNIFMNRVFRNSHLLQIPGNGRPIRRDRSLSDSMSHRQIGGNNRQQQSQPLKPGLSNEYVCREIMDYYQRNRQSNDKYKSKQILRQSLENTLKQSFPNYFINLHVIGSSTNGIGDNASTVDICVLARKKLSLPTSPETGNNNAENPNTELSSENKNSSENTKTASPEKFVNSTGEKLSQIVLAAADSNTYPFDENNEISLKNIEKVLESKNFARNIVLIPARVPVIKFQDIICNLNVTLNLNQEVSIRNTQLIRDYSKMDWRFPQLAMIVKQWARENRINSAVDKSISPYSWTLMVIHYLQVVEPPVLPCLQKMVPQRYESKTDIEEEVNQWRQTPIKWQSQNQNTLKQLMKGLFRYFGYVFDYDQHIVSVREGKVLNRIYCRSANNGSTTTTTTNSNNSNVNNNNNNGNNNGNQLNQTADDNGNSCNNSIQWNSLMCVEEPFTRSNTTRSVHDHETFERIKELLRMSSNALKGNRISLFNIIVDDLEFPLKY